LKSNIYGATRIAKTVQQLKSQSRMGFAHHWNNHNNAMIKLLKCVRPRAFCECTVYCTVL